MVSRKSHQRETTLSVIVEYCSDLGRRPVALRPIRPYQIVIHGPILPNSGPTRLTGLPDGYLVSPEEARLRVNNIKKCPLYGSNQYQELTPLRGVNNIKN